MKSGARVLLSFSRDICTCELRRTKKTVQIRIASLLFLRAAGVAAPVTQAREIQYATTHNGRTTRQKISLIKKKDPERSARFLFLHAKFFLVAVSVRAALSLYFREKGEKNTLSYAALISVCPKSEFAAHDPLPPPKKKEPYST